MEIEYATSHLECLCTLEKYLKQKMDASVAKKLKLRISELRSVDTIEDLLAGTGRWEQMRGDRSGQWSARLSRNWRLIVELTDSSKCVRIVDILDYH